MVESIAITPKVTAISMDTLMLQANGTKGCEKMQTQCSNVPSSLHADVCAQLFTGINAAI